eukprot:TRINITY_DN61976_c0_g1_i1.p1 TRINITY_DN61976_c0_g1~~TRINITY_DN61976_c0_g1_i1.p1  ORF type:complete len:493 (-),score=68.29 TRINITY_DN61976_c0_g1_i1:143-1447(-)
MPSSSYAAGARQAVPVHRAEYGGFLVSAERQPCSEQQPPRRPQVQAVSPEVLATPATRPAQGVRPCRSPLREPRNDPGMLVQRGQDARMQTLRAQGALRQMPKPQSTEEALRGVEGPSVSTGATRTRLLGPRQEPSSSTTRPPADGQRQELLRPRIHTSANAAEMLRRPSERTVVRSPLRVDSEQLVPQATAMRSTGATADLEQKEKDSRLVEFIQLVSVRGCGELDPEPASALLEDAGWDVAEAFTRLCGVPPSHFPSPTSNAEGADVGSFTDAQHLRMQQEEWLPESFVRGLARGLLHHSDAADGRGSHLFGSQDEEASHLHAVLMAMVDEQDEADLRDALLVSSNEAYSGGYSVPPVDEAVLARSSTTGTYRKTLAATDDQCECSVCLSPFEEGDSLRTLQCNHRFHLHCVDRWLSQSGQCPVCKVRIGRE